jgi:hypothetical protein
MKALPANRACIFSGPHTLAFPNGHDRTQANFFLAHKESLHRFQQSNEEESILLALYAQICWRVGLQENLSGLGFSSLTFEAGPPALPQLFAVSYIPGREK